MKKISCLILSLALVCTIILFVPEITYAATSGTCGNNLTWTLDDTGTLIISGYGEMYDWTYHKEYSANTPWYNIRYEIKNVIIEDGVTNIGNCAFWGCNLLNEVTMADSITTIGSMAFWRCNWIKNISLSNNISEIGNDAFYECSSMQNIELPYSLTAIGSGAFAYCSDLEIIKIPYNIKIINDNTFVGCSSLKNITLPSAITTIGNHAFYSCKNLTDIYYNGTESQWHSISIEDNNSDFLNTIIHYTDIFEISSATDFADIQNDPSAYYVLINDIILNTNTRIKDFSGTLDGQGHTITVFYSSKYGLFDNILDDGNVRNTTIIIQFDNSNSSFAESSISDVKGWGGIALVNNGYIVNCNISGTNWNVGGGSLRGGIGCYGDVSGGSICSVNNGIISLCRSTVNANYQITMNSAYCHLGGLVGTMRNGKIEKSFNSGSITAIVYDGVSNGNYALLGGIVGSGSQVFSCATTKNMHLVYDGGRMLSGVGVGFITGTEQTLNLGLWGPGRTFGNDCIVSDNISAYIDYYGNAYDMLDCKISDNYTVKKVSEIEEWWNNLISDDPLPTATSTPSPMATPETVYESVHRVTGYNAQKKTVQLDYNVNYGITDKNIDYNSLVGKFALVRTDAFNIVSIRRIDDGFGMATNIKDTSIDIDGKTYKLGGYADTIFIEENERMHYFYDGDTIFGVSDLLELNGRLEDWNESNQTVTINGIVYTISRFSNISQSVINNIKNAIGTEVNYTSDDVNDLYSLDLQEIGSIISLSPAPGTLDNLWNKSEVNFEADLYGNLSYDADNPGEVYLKNYITDEVIYKATPSITETNLGHTKLSFSVYNSNIPTETKLYIDINKDAKLYNNGEALVITPNKDTWSFTTQFGLDKKDLFGFINNYGSFWGADEYFEKETNKFRFTSKKNPYPIVSKDLENKIIGIIGKSEYKYYTGKQNKFNGVCFGMSFITALNKNGLFDPSSVGNTNAKSLNDLPKPVEASGQIANGTRDCINYYHMLQSKLTGGLTNYDVEKAKFLLWEKDKVYDVLTTVVSDAFEVPNNKKPFLLLMGIGGKGDAYLHAVVVLGARENKEENCYELLLKDPNNSVSLFKVAKVALNYSNITYDDEEVVLLKEIDVTKINPDYLINSTANASAAFENDSEEYDIIKILGSGDFIVTNSDGETLCYNNGDLSGNMEIINSDFCDSGEDNAPEYVFTVNKSDRYTFETGDSQTKCTVKSGETFISANAYNADSVVIDKNQGININGSNITYDAFSTTLTGGNMFSVSGGNTNNLNIALSADGSAEIQADTLKDVEFESLFEDKSFVFDSDSGTADVVETEAGGLAVPGAEIHDETTFSNIIKENNGGAEVTFANNTAQNQTGTGIVAKYNNDGTLIDIETIDLNLSGNESKTVVYGEGNIKYKAFVWDGFDNMRPLSASAEISL